jgi:hypothetical protein
MKPMNRLSAVTTGVLIVGTVLVGCATQPSEQAAAQWIALLDGPKGLDNWNRVGDANWRVVDGTVQADGVKGSGFLVTKNAYGDFQLRAEFWVDDAANSGIFIRCADPQKIGAASCYEVNIFDQRPDPAFGTGAIVYFAHVSPMPKAGGKWNTYEITAKGTHLVVKLNGVQTVDLQNKKHKSGPIALQWGSGIVKFRKVQIRPL